MNHTKESKFFIQLYILFAVIFNLNFILNVENITRDTNLYSEDDRILLSLLKDKN